eukprot:g7869.t1
MVGVVRQELREGNATVKGYGEKLAADLNAFCTSSGSNGNGAAAGACRSEQDFQSLWTVEEEMHTKAHLKRLWPAEEFFLDEEKFRKTKDFFPEKEQEGLALLQNWFKWKQHHAL